MINREYQITPTIGGVRFEDLTGVLPEPLDKVLACLWLAPVRGLKDDYRLARAGIEEYVLTAGVRPINVPKGFMVSMVKLTHVVSEHKNDVFHAELLHMFLVALRNIVQVQGYYGDETIHWDKLEDCLSSVTRDLGALHTRLYFVAERFPEEALHPHIFDTPESDKL